MKVIRLMPSQVPMFWDAIKFATGQTDRLNKDYYEEYYTELLCSLLSGKAQCFVRLNEERVLTALLITRIVVNKISGSKQLVLQNVYAWEPLTEDIWNQAYELYTELARQEGCTLIAYSSYNPKVWENMERYGFREMERVYILPFERGGMK